MLDIALVCGVSQSKLLMPLSFASIVGGTCTLVGTSTNILVSSLASDRGVEPFSMFELTKLGIVFLATPFGYHTNLMVYAQGGYRFSDYLKIGIPLNLLLWLAASLLIPIFWPL